MRTRLNSLLTLTGALALSLCGCGDDHLDELNGGSLLNSSQTVTVSSVSTTVQTPTVTAPTDSSLAIVPGAAVHLSRGASTRLALVLTRSDGSTQDLTEAATWSTSQPDRLMVSNASGEHGLVTAGETAGGDTLVIARVNGFAATVTVTVDSAALTDIQIGRLDPRLPLGYSRQLPVVGVFADGSTGSVSRFVTYSVADPAVVSCSSTGLLTGLKAGDTTVTATSGNLSRSFPVTVTTATLAQLRLTPNGSNLQLAPDLTEDFTAVAQFSDGTLLDATDQAQFASSNSDTASADAGGHVRSLAPGTTQVSASLNGTQSAPVALTVADGVVGYREQRIPFVFHDISGSGHLEDSHLTYNTKPFSVTDFPFRLFGTALTTANSQVSASGFLSFDPATTADFIDPYTLPQPSRQSIAIWAAYNRGNVYSLVEGSSPSRTLTVQYNLQNEDNASFSCVSQMVLYESTNVIEFRYASVAPEGDADFLAGVQGANDAQYFQHNAGTANFFSSSAVRLLP